MIIRGVLPWTSSSRSAGSHARRTIPWEEVPIVQTDGMLCHSSMPCPPSNIMAFRWSTIEPIMMAVNLGSSTSLRVSGLEQVVCVKGGPDIWKSGKSQAGYDSVYDLDEDLFRFILFPLLALVAKLTKHVDPIIVFVRDDLAIGLICRIYLGDTEIKWSGDAVDESNANASHTLSHHLLLWLHNHTVVRSDEFIEVHKDSLPLARGLRVKTMLVDVGWHD